MRHRDYIAVRKIVDEIDVATDLLGELTEDMFIADERTKRAVCMTVINIGELVKTVTDETRTKYSKLPWKLAAGFRDIAAHKYQTLNMGDVYQTVADDLPKFKNQLREILDCEQGEMR